MDGSIQSARSRYKLKIGEYAVWASEMVQKHGKGWEAKHSELEGTDTRILRDWIIKFRAMEHVLNLDQLEIKKDWDQFVLKRPSSF